MNLEKAKEIVIQVILEVIESKHEISEQTQLIGSDNSLDSMQLVEVCLALEDLAEKYDFNFDWTSEAAMSKSHSMFRTVATLAEEFFNQRYKNENQSN